MTINELGALQLHSFSSPYLAQIVSIFDSELTNAPSVRGSVAVVTKFSQDDVMGAKLCPVFYCAFTHCTEDISDDAKSEVQTSLRA
jgi:3-hydroxyacyl-CoA dehydrogenase